MKQVGVSTAAAILYLLSGCSSAPASYADNHEGRAAAAELCDSMRTFVAAPLDASGLRRAWFLPFGSYEDLRLCQLKTETTFRASFRQTSSGRSVEISAAEKTTSVLIAERTWKGDLEQALTFGSDDEAAPDKSTQPMCKDAPS
jgi:hypothetical protein